MRQHGYDSGTNNRFVVPDQERSGISLLSPTLVEALNELAQVEDLPLATLIALLLNEGLDRRSRRRP
jgi:hypothetical protein